MFKNQIGLCLVAIFGLIGLINASALTFVLGAQEQSCYYIFTTKSSRVGYYFAVQSGGSFDVDYTIKDPDGRIIASDEKQRQGDFVLNAEKVGEYEFCFANGMSTFAEKVVDFEIKLEDDFKAQLPDTPNKQIAVETMVESVERLDSQLNGLLRTLQYYKTRNNRNQSTVKSTESRIFYFSFLEVLLMVGMAVLQVFVVQYFFKGSRKQLV